MVLPLWILEDGGENVPNTVRGAARRNSDAVVIYPGIGIPVSEQVYGDAIEITEAVFQWVEERP